MRRHDLDDDSEKEPRRRAPRTAANGRAWQRMLRVADQRSRQEACSQAPAAASSPEHQAAHNPYRRTRIRHLICHHSSSHKTRPRVQHLPLESAFKHRSSRLGGLLSSFLCAALRQGDAQSEIGIGTSPRDRRFATCDRRMSALERWGLRHIGDGLSQFLTPSGRQAHLAVA